MKLLKKGRPQRGWSKELFCTGDGNGGGGCGALLLVEEGDLFQTYSSFCGRDQEWYVTFSCSQCGVHTDVKNSPLRPHQLPTFQQWKEREAKRQAALAESYYDK